MVGAELFVPVEEGLIGMGFVVVYFLGRKEGMGRERERERERNHRRGPFGGRLDEG